MFTPFFGISIFLIALNCIQQNQARVEVQNGKAEIHSSFFGTNRGAKMLMNPKFVMVKTAKEIKKEKLEKAKSDVNFINKNNGGLWEASVFLPFALMKEEDKALMYGTIPSSPNENSFNATYVDMLLDSIGNVSKNKEEVGVRKRRSPVEMLPEEFSPSQKWPECASIFNEIMNQGKCSSCWAVVSSAVISDRICIWRLKKLDELIEDWKINAKWIFKSVHYEEQKIIKWETHGEKVEVLWLKSKQIFGQSFQDTEKDQILLDYEKSAIKENWFRIIMGNWFVDKKFKQFSDLENKITAFHQWYNEVKLQKRKTPIFKIEGSFVAPADEEKSQLFSYWCGHFRRDLHSGQNVKELELPILREFVGNDQEFMGKLYRLWAKPEDKNAQVEFEMAKNHLLNIFNYYNKDGPEEAFENFYCRLEELKAGHWNWALNDDIPYMGMVEFEKAQTRMRELLGKWQDVEQYLTNPFMDLNNWKREMLELFKQEAAKPKNVASAFHMLTCALEDGVEEKCSTGYHLDLAFQFARNQGIVSGLKWNSGQNSGCKPYTILPSLTVQSQKHVDLNCEAKCSNSSWKDERVAKLGTGQQIWDRQILLENGHSEAEIEQLIMAEIKTNGPVAAAIFEANSLDYYKRGIYSRTNPILRKDQEDKIKADQAKARWAHAIRLLGWGQDENGVKYWLAANSWGTEWGEGGFFRVIRGINEVGIEGDIVFPQFD